MVGLVVHHRSRHTVVEEAASIDSSGVEAAVGSHNLVEEEEVHILEVGSSSAGVGTAVAVVVLRILHDNLDSLT